MEKHPLDDCVPIRVQNDGTYIITVNGCDYGVCDNSENEKYTIDMVKAYALAHPDMVEPEAPPPKPTPEQIRAITIAQLDALDRKSLRYLREIAEGTIDEEGKKRLADLEAQAKALRETL